VPCGTKSPPARTDVRREPSSCLLLVEIFPLTNPGTYLKFSSTVRLFEGVEPQTISEVSYGSLRGCVVPLSFRYIFSSCAEPQGAGFSPILRGSQPPIPAIRRPGTGMRMSPTIRRGPSIRWDCGGATFFLMLTRSGVTRGEPPYFSIAQVVSLIPLDWIRVFRPMTQLVWSLRGVAGAALAGITARWDRQPTAHQAQKVASTFLSFARMFRRVLQA
jgi:hypothetical protein